MTAICNFCGNYGCSIATLITDKGAKFLDKRGGGGPSIKFLPDVRGRKTRVMNRTI